MDKFQVRLNDTLCSCSHETASGWAELRLICADMVLSDACKSRRHWRNACFALAALLVLALGGLAYVVLQ